MWSLAIYCTDGCIIQVISMSLTSAALNGTPLRLSGWYSVTARRTSCLRSLLHSCRRRTIDLTTSYMAKVNNAAASIER